MIVTNRLVVTVPETRVAAVTAIVRKYDPIGGAQILSPGLNNDGDPGKPTDTRWFSWAMDRATRDAMADDLSRIPGVTIDDDTICPSASTHAAVLTRIGKKPIVKPNGTGNQAVKT